MSRLKFPLCRAARSARPPTDVILAPRLTGRNWPRLCGNALGDIAAVTPLTENFMQTGDGPLELGDVLRVEFVALSDQALDRGEQVVVHRARSPVSL
jgi:hypothetical protein